MVMMMMIIITNGFLEVLKYTTHFSVLRRNFSDTIPLTKIHHHFDV